MPRTSANTAAAAAADERELSARSPRPAQKMGRYRILRLLGAGGMGAVYEAYDPELGRKLAIKVLRPLSDDDGNEARASHERARLLREAKTLARLSHPNIVSIFDVGILDDDAVFVAMELIAGETMRQFLERSATDKRIDWRMRLDVALQAGEGLAGAHAAGLLHRDFKPDNLMVGNDGVVRVLDFGLARDAHAQVGEEESSANDRPSLGWTSGTGEGSVSQTWSGESGAQSSKAQRNNSKTSKRRTDNDDLTRAGTLIGTPAYMAPEQLRGEPIQASGDLFALASVIFEALCGARPFPLEPISLRVQAIAVGQLKWPRYIPSWLSHLVGRALAFDPGERGDDVRGLVDQIRHGLAREAGRRKMMMRAGIALLPIALATTWWQWPAPPLDPDCRDPAPRIVDTWNDEVRTRLAAGFAATQHGSAQQLAAGAVKAIDTWQSAWLDSAALLCPETRASSGLLPLDVQQREQSWDCLGESRAQVAALVQVWHAPTLQQVWESGDAALSLSSPRDCVDLETLAKRTPLPIDAYERQVVKDMRERLRGIEVQTDQAAFDQAQHELNAIREVVFSVGYLPLLAEFSGAKSDLEWTHGGAREINPVWRAKLIGLAANAPTMQSIWTSREWILRVYRQDERTASAEILGDQAAAAQRGGNPPADLAELERHRGIWMSLHAKHESALVSFEQSLAHTRAAFGDNSTQTAWKLADLGFVSSLIGRHDLALSYNRKCLDIVSEVLPPGHPRRARAVFQLADALRYAGRPSEAAFEFERSRKECVDAGMPTTMCAVVADNLGGMYAALGRYTEALAEFSMALQVEHDTQERLGRVAPWVEQKLGDIFAKRGEVVTASELEALGLDKLRAESGVQPGALADAIILAMVVSTSAQDFDRSRILADEAQEVLARPSEWVESISAHLSEQRGVLALKNRAPNEALSLFESALHSAFASYTPDELAKLELHSAQALLAANLPGIASERANAALSRYLSLDGLPAHVFVPFYETLADIALAQHRYDEALQQLALAHLHFDPVQVLDNRRASLWFLEAKVWLQLDHSEDGRAHAYALAKQALAAYEDWDVGADAAIREVQDWLSRYEATGTGHAM